MTTEPREVPTSLPEVETHDTVTARAGTTTTSKSGDRRETPERESPEPEPPDD
jgi:hypothetical protein